MAAAAAVAEVIFSLYVKYIERFLVNYNNENDHNTAVEKDFDCPFLYKKTNWEKFQKNPDKEYKTVIPTNRN